MSTPMPPETATRLLDLIRLGTYIEPARVLLANGWTTDDLKPHATSEIKWTYLESILRQQAPKATTNGHKPLEPDPPSHRLNSRRLSQVIPRAQDWLWPHRIPSGTLTIIGGVQGLGKSFITLDMAMRVTMGRPWPDSDRRRVPGSVVILSLEDDPETTIRPRFDAMGGDPERVTLLEGVEEIDHSGARVFHLVRDLHHLEDTVRQLGDVQLVIIDPVTAYLGGDSDIYRDNEVRAALNPLVLLAREMSLAVVGVMHLRKAPSDKAIFRVLGSVSFTALARSALLVGEDRQDPEARVLLPAKLNVAKAAPGLRFRIADPGLVDWLGPTDQTADECFAPQETDDMSDGSIREAAMDFLRAILSDGPQKGSDVRRQAKENSISERTLERARADLGISADNGGVFGSAWYWRLPDNP